MRRRQSGDSLAEIGRLLVPLTLADQTGGFLLIHSGDSHRCSERYASRTRITPCVGGREPGAEARLEAALARSGLHTIRSLRPAPEAPDETCWLEGDGWWLSTAPVPSVAPERITMVGLPWVARRRS